MKKKLISLIMVALCCLAMGVGCASNSKEELTFVSGDKCKVVVVGDAEANYVSAIVQKFNDVTGVTPKVYSGEEAPEDLTQIVVGNPDELDVSELASEIPYFGYLIRVLEGNVYILAYDDEVLIEAVTDFLGEFENWYSDDKMKIEGNYEVLKSVSEEFPVAEVPYLEGGENAGVFDCDNDHQMVLVEGVEKDEFEAYCNELASNGYSLYSENEINGNLFKTYYTEEGVMLHTYWTEFFEEVRTIVAKTSLLPIQSNTDAVCTPLLHQFKALDEEQADGGMGYAIRLADGRFIIVDGGDPTEENRDAIYTFLKENALDPNNIVIASWYITHAHEDHGGAFLEFAEKYSSDNSIKLESIMFNPCDTSEQMMYCTSITMNLESTFATNYPNVPIYKPLTGQVYTFGKTTIEILYTMSDFLPNTIQYESDGKGGDYNIQSMVSIIDIDSTADLKDRWFVMGDTTTTACNEMCYRYGDYMKCDYVQVSHHGLAPLPTGANCRRHGATVEIYGLIDADIALWPTSEAKVKERSELEVNDYLVSIVDEIVTAGKGGRTFEIK
ncbi:MAG: hypothetical protein IJZ53_04100 [Tyzzerella sp.]|nr:hypothetical protein [Tyzzerella sp.]